MIHDYNGRNLRLLTSVVTDPNGRDHNVCQCVSGTEREIERGERERGNRQRAEVTEKSYYVKLIN